MILFHFTTVELLRPDMTPGDAIIPPEGLVTSKAEVWAPAAVWLTTDQQPGRPAPATNCVRITVKIPSTDRRLIRWSRLQASRLVTAIPADFSVDLWERARRDWWLYRGHVPPERWAAIEIIRNQQPWWLMPNTD